MIAIIAEKPSVGQDIARVVGATEKMDGYITGNGYMVTWALGHLVSLALPGTYGYTRTTAEDLPMIPEPFRLVPRQIRTDRGMVTDIAAGKQLKIIDEVFSKCDSIIVATDAGREYNPQIQISAESETKRSIFREKDKTKRSKKESAQHSKSRNKSFVMTSVSAL